MGVTGIIFRKRGQERDKYGPVSIYQYGRNWNYIQEKGGGRGRGKYRPMVSISDGNSDHFAHS